MVLRVLTPQADIGILNSTYGGNVLRAVCLHGISCVS